MFAHELHLEDFPIQFKPGRIALVVGNATYLHVDPLRNPTNDASDMATVLREIGFEVHEHQDASASQFRRAIDRFLKVAQSCDLRLIYYAGHGIQYHGANYMIPVDSALTEPEHVEYDCIDVGRILAPCGRFNKGANVLILDACRDHPFARPWRGVVAPARGLAPITAPRGTLICYATAPGDVAADGHGRNGTYTGTLLRHLTKPRTDFQQVLRNVRREVMELTYGRQVPWESTSLTDDLVLVDEHTEAVANLQRHPELRSTLSYCIGVDENLARLAKTERTILGRSSEGAGLDIFRENGEVKKIEYIEYGESGRSEEIYYFRQGAPIFSTMQLYRYNRPFYFDKQKAEEVGDIEWFDHHKTRVETSVVRWLSSGRPVVVLTDGKFSAPVPELTNAFLERLSQAIEDAKIATSEL
jgi:hypothetical protein